MRCNTRTRKIRTCIKWNEKEKQNYFNGENNHWLCLYRTLIELQPLSSASHTDRGRPSIWFCLLIRYWNYPMNDTETIRFIKLHVSKTWKFLCLWVQFAWAKLWNKSKWKVLFNKICCFEFLQQQQTIPVYSKMDAYGCNTQKLIWF